MTSETNTVETNTAAVGHSQITREPQYARCIELQDSFGLTNLGLMSNQVWHDDPRRLGITLSRYKFVAKMLAGSKRALEIGCADAFATRIVCQEVPEVVAIDFDPLFVESANANSHPDWPMTCQVHDILERPLDEVFDAVFSLDVLEHIPSEREDDFIRNASGSLVERGVMIVGIPSLESQVYASPGSKAGHVNCKTAGELKSVMERHFHNVFIFSMNDEVVHTGYYPMAQYLLALCCAKRLVQ